MSVVMTNLYSNHVSIDGSSSVAFRGFSRAATVCQAVAQDSGVPVQGEGTPRGAGIV